MKKILYTIIFTSIVISTSGIALAESKIANKVFGSKDCSQYSTKTFTGLSDYVRCKKGLEPTEKNFFKSLKWKKREKTFDPNKSCDEYSTKTFTGLAAKMKCLRSRKN